MFGVSRYQILDTFKNQEVFSTIFNHFDNNTFKVVFFIMYKSYNCKGILLKQSK